MLRLACQAAWINTAHCVPRILQHRSQCWLCVQCCLTLTVPVFFFFLLTLWWEKFPTNKSCWIFTRKLNFKYFITTGVPAKWEKHKMALLKWYLCWGSDKSLQVCWKLTICQHFSSRHTHNLTFKQGGGRLTTDVQPKQIEWLIITKVLSSIKCLIPIHTVWCSI